MAGLALFSSDGKALPIPGGRIFSMPKLMNKTRSAIFSLLTELYLSLEVLRWYLGALEQNCDQIKKRGFMRISTTLLPEGL